MIERFRMWLNTWLGCQILFKQQCDTLAIICDLQNDLARVRRELDALREECAAGLSLRN